MVNDIFESDNLSYKNLLTIKDIKIKAGDQWIYSAGFNVDISLSDTKRIDIELDDIRYIADCGARLAILSHQGNWRNQTAIHLDFIAEYLSKRLDRKVHYFPENNSETAVKYSYSMQNGQIAIFGNTRLNEGEERGNINLAKQFSHLGNFVAISGFSKSHRVHASNVGILSFLPGYATHGFLYEIANLEQLIKQSPQLKSIAIIGGIKLEKITKGFKLFKNIYNFIIPSGALLNNILKVRKIPIGSSYLGEEPEAAFAATEEILSLKEGASLLLPDYLIIAKKNQNGSYYDSKVINIGQAIPEDYMIVDFLISDQMNRVFSASEELKVRVIIAGTPCLTKNGFTSSSNAILKLMSNDHVISFMMGGNTIEDLPFDCMNSTGGGAALYYMAERTCPVLDELIRNQKKWKKSNEF